MQVLLAMTVYQIIVSSKLPTTSTTVPIIGQYTSCCLWKIFMTNSISYCSIQSVSRAISCVYDFICLSLRALKWEQLELSTPISIAMYVHSRLTTRIDTNKVNELSKCKLSDLVVGLLVDTTPHFFYFLACYPMPATSMICAVVVCLSVWSYFFAVSVKHQHRQTNNVTR